VARCARAALAALVAAGAAGLAPAASPSAALASGLTVINVGMGMDPTLLVVEGRRAAIGAEEWREGRDLNGDGDLLDVVLHTYDAGAARLTNLQVALEYTVTGPRVAAWYGADVIAIANETYAKIDYNNDGDRLDVVLLQVNGSTGAARFLVTGASGVVVQGDYAVVTRSEITLNVDLNGDGDRVDQVLATVHIPRRKLTSLGVAVLHIGQVVTAPGTVAFMASEVYEQRDHNADGDTQDEVIFVHDIAANRTTNTKLQGRLIRDGDIWTWRIPGPLVVFFTTEALHGADLNGDGDTADEIPHVVEPVSHAVHADLPGSAFVSRAGRLPLVVWESWHGQDVNGDGDADDGVFTFARQPGGGRWITGLAMRYGTGASWAIDPLGHAAGEVDEAASGHSDLNGDGDALDLLVARFDPASETVDVFDAISHCSAIPLPTVMRGERVVTCVPESELGADLNLDGDAVDIIAMSLDMTSGQQRSSDLAMDITATPKLIGAFAHVLVSELKQSKDLNRDGDTQDEIVHRFDTTTGATANTALEPYPLLSSAGWKAGSHESFIAAWEGQGGGDYNGDGDTGDYVLHVVR